MKKLMMMIALAAVLAACGGTEDPPADEALPAEDEGMSMEEFAETDDILAWAREFGAPDDLELVEPGIAVSHEARTVYALDCARGEEFVVEGAEYGPVPRAEGGDGTPGYMKICRS